jgi:hypothetical protein
MFTSHGYHPADIVSPVVWNVRALRPGMRSARFVATPVMRRSR